MLYYLSYLVAGIMGVVMSRVLNKEQQMLTLIVVGVGGLFYAYFSHEVSTWICWLSFMVGFWVHRLMICWVRKNDNKERNLYSHYFTKDAKGNYTLHSFKIIDGGRR